jgi:hypothetical protein
VLGGIAVVPTQLDKGSYHKLPRHLDDEGGEIFGLRHTTAAGDDPITYFIENQLISVDPSAPLAGRNAKYTCQAHNNFAAPHSSLQKLKIS